MKRNLYSQIKVPRVLKLIIFISISLLQILSLQNLPTTNSFTMSLSASTTKAANAATKNIVVIGGGIQGTSVAYHLWKKMSSSSNKTNESKTKIILLEAKEPAAAASGKGGGFMARSWGDGSPTESLHHVAFDMYQSLAQELDCKSYRKLPVLSVPPGADIDLKSSSTRKGNNDRYMPNWLDGKIGRRGIQIMGMGDDTAQITPKEFVLQMLKTMTGTPDTNDDDNETSQSSTSSSFELILGECIGVNTEALSDNQQKVTGIRYRPVNSNDDEESTDENVQTISAEKVIVSAGPWSCKAEDWFDNVVNLPMEGVKSTSIVWKQPVVTTDDGEEEKMDVDATALFCGEDYRFGTHLEVYPRPSGEIYICGIGGSDYISQEDLKSGAFLQECNAKEDRVKAATNAFQSISKTYQDFGELDRVQSCMRPCPKDALPYMGSIPTYDGAYINAGHNCWGIAWAPACGKAIAELVLEGESKSVDLSPFDPGRFTRAIGRGRRGRKRQGESVGEQW